MTAGATAITRSSKIAVVHAVQPLLEAPLTTKFSISGPVFKRVYSVTISIACTTALVMGSRLSHSASSSPAPSSIKRRQRSEEHTSELQSRGQLVCRLLLEKKNQQ